MPPILTATTKQAENFAQNSMPNEKSEAYQRGFADGVKDAAAKRYQDQCPHYDLRSPLRREWREGYNAGFDSPPQSVAEPTPIEIKPVVDKHPLRRAYVDVIAPLYTELQHREFGSDKTSARHLDWMCQELLRDIQTMPLDKIGRWVGFIQGVMATRGALDVDKERNRTRPIFERAAQATATELAALTAANASLAEQLKQTRSELAALKDHAK